VVRLDAQKDNITGICNGKGRVQIRCSNQANASEIISRFAQRGIKAQVKSQKKVKEITDVTNEVLQ